jgi:hypothetical protein
VKVTVIAGGLAKQVVAVAAPQGELHAQDLWGAPKRKRKKRKDLPKVKPPKE